MPKSSPVNLENLIHFIRNLISYPFSSVFIRGQIAFPASLIKLTSLARPWVLFRLRRRTFSLFRGETPLLGTADLAMCVKPFQNEFARRGAHRIRLVRGQPEGPRLLHQPL